MFKWCKLTARIKALERQLAATQQDRDDWYNMYVPLLTRANTLELENDRLTRSLANAREAENILNERVRNAHFRDPKTGRILPKGRRR